MNLLAIFIGAGLGGLMRYFLSELVHFVFPKSFPFGTLAVNIIGCFFMGYLVTYILKYYKGEAPLLSSFLLIGLLGGFTTFSSFSLEAVSLFQSGEVFKTINYIILSVGICIFALYLGQLVAK